MVIADGNLEIETQSVLRVLILEPVTTTSC